MELIPRNVVSIHLIDENFLFADEIIEKYSWKKNFAVNFYPSPDKFITDNIRKPLSVNETHIVILAVQLSKPDIQASDNLAERINIQFPGIEIIRVCHEKEVTCKSSQLRKDNVIKIINNENALLRIDNAINWVLAKVNMDNKYRKYSLAFYLLVISILFSAVFFFFFLFTGK